MLPASFGPSEVTRLKQLINDGVATLTEVKALQEGLSDTIKSLSEELDIPAKLLKKAISVSHKGSYAEEEESLQDLEKLLKAVGKC